jgi:hypothetical protein
MGILVTENNTVYRITESGARGPAGPAGGSYNVRQVSADTTAAINDFLQVDASAGAVTITLPTPTNGSHILVSKTDSTTNAVVITGVANIVYPDTTLHLYADGTAWRLI